MAENGDKSNAFEAGHQHLGNVYAKALLGVTEAAKITESVLAEFESLLIDVFGKMPQFEAALASPRISHEEKVRLLDKAFQGRMSAQLLQFLKVVSKHGRLNILRSIHRAARKLFDDMRGRVLVGVQTAEPLGADLIQLITGQLQAKLGREVVLNTKVDPKLIGGLVVRVGDKVFDGSVANQLRRMRDAALESTATQMREGLNRFEVAS